MAEYSLIEIVNDNQTVLIDSESPNYVMVSKGTVPISSAGGMNRILWLELPIIAGEPSPIIAFYTNRRIFTWRAGTTNGVYVYSIAIDATAAEVGALVEYFVFKDIRLYPPTGTGLVVLRDQWGNIIFDSDSKITNIVDFISVSATTNSTYQKQYAPDRKLAISCISPSVKVAGGAGPGGWSDVWAMGGAILSGNMGDVRNWHYRGSLGSSVEYVNPYATFMVIDVTKY